MSCNSYWQECHVSADNQATIKSWFAGFADDMEVTKAEVLCEVQTDREKKIRIFARKDGEGFVLVRTKGRSFSISRKRVAA